jgi:hypothetical protein
MYNVATGVTRWIISPTPIKVPAVPQEVAGV